MKVRTITLRQANEFVAAHHRHHGPVVGAKFAIAAVDGEELVGVAIAGRPVARGLDDGKTLEVLRVATNGAANACSFLLSRVRKAAPHLGYSRVVTYILGSESGASLRAAGFSCVAHVAGASWHRDARPRIDKAPVQDKLRFEALA